MVNTSKDFIENFKGCPFFSVIKTYAFKCVLNAA